MRGDVICRTCERPAKNRDQEQLIDKHEDEIRALLEASAKMNQQYNALREEAAWMLAVLTALAEKEDIRISQDRVEGILAEEAELSITRKSVPALVQTRTHTRDILIRLDTTEKKSDILEAPV